MISLAWKVLLNSFFSQPWQSVAEGRYICTFPAWLLPHSSPALPRSVPWVEAALGSHSSSTSAVRQESFCELSHIIALQQAKRNVFSELAKSWELRISSSGSPPCALLRATCRRDTANSDIKHVVLLCKHSNVSNSVLFTISANEIIGEKRRKQK